METNLKEKLAQLEAEVGVIKDPNLRQIAFTKLMDTLVRPSPAARGAASSGTPKKPAVRPGQKSKIREKVQKLPLTGATDGLPNFRDCKRAWEGQLWVLAVAKQNRVEGLNNHEIAYLLTKRLYKQTKYSTVNYIKDKVGAGFVYLDPQTQCWVITPEGEKHLQSLPKGTDSIDKK